MLSNDQPTSDEGKPSRRRINWELYYYERVGDRLYFRITPFAIILMLAAALVGFTILIIDSRKNPPRQTNINVTLPLSSQALPDQQAIEHGCGHIPL